VSAATATQHTLGHPDRQLLASGSAEPDPLADVDTFGRTADSSAAKALLLIDAFAGPRGVLGVTELAARARLSKSTAHRLLTVLMAQGFVRRVGDRYCLSEHLFELGNYVRLCRPNGLRHRAMPFLAELFAQTHQTIHLAVLRGTEVLYVEKLFGHDPAPCDTAIGARRPAYATALGKAMIAFSPPEIINRNLSVDFKRITPFTIVQPTQLGHALDRVRNSGYATDHEEYRLGVNCLAAPIRDPQTGAVIAGLSVCSMSSIDLERRFSRLLIKVANEISQTHLAA